MNSSYRYLYNPCDISIVNSKTGVSFDETSLVAFEKKPENLVAVGYKAKELRKNSTSDIVVMSPLKGGIIANFDEGVYLFKELINRVYKISTFNKPNIILKTPANLTDIEERAFEECIHLAGGRRVQICQGESCEDAENTDISITIKNY